MAITKKYSRSDLRRPQQETTKGDDLKLVRRSRSESIAMGAYPTPNKMGYSFSKIDDGPKHWISSLPDSQNPLLDLGSGHGFQTLAAIKAGRKVISVDCCEKNLESLRLHVNKELNMENGACEKKRGALVNTVMATLPKEHLFPDESAAGILLSEVIHFIPHQDVLPIFLHALQWLEKGGLFVVSTVSPNFYPYVLKSLGETITAEELSSKWEFVKNATNEELVSTPVFKVNIKNSEGTDLSSVRSSQMRSTDELLVLAQWSGFEVLLVDYLSCGKYPDGAKHDAVSLLVARKPE